MKHSVWIAIALRGGAFIHTKPPARGHYGFRPCDKSISSLFRGCYLAVESILSWKYLSSTRALLATTVMQDDTRHWELEHRRDSRAVVTLRLSGPTHLAETAMIGSIRQ